MITLPSPVNKWKLPVLNALPALICLIIIGAQYYFRRFDDNHFAGWKLAFSAKTPPDKSFFFTILIPALLLVSGVFKASLPRRARLPFLFLLCFIGTAFLWSVPEVNVDTSRYFMQAKHLELHGVRYFLAEWGKAIPAWTDLPAVQLLDGIIFRFFGEDRIFIQIFNTLLFSLTAVLTALIGRELWDEDTGFYAGLLLLGMPGLLILTPLMMVDVPLMFFLMLSIYLVIRAVTGEHLWHTAAAVSAVFFTLWSKYSSIPMLSILPLITVILSWESTETESRRKIIQRSLAIYFTSLILICATAVLKLDTIENQIKLLRSVQLPSFNWWVESYVSSFLFQINPIISITAAASLVLAARKRDKKYLIVAFLPLLFLVFQIKRFRYMLPAFPMLALMAAYGFGILRSHGYRKIIIACILTTSLATTFFVYKPYLMGLSSINLKEAGAVLDTLDITTVSVHVLPQQNYPINPAVAVPLLDLFTRKKIVYDYIPDASTPDKAFRFRFSWAYRNPDYYSSSADIDAEDTGKAFLIILGRPQDHIPSALTKMVSRCQHSASFFTYDSQFVYQTLVIVYW